MATTATKPNDTMNAPGTIFEIRSNGIVTATLKNVSAREAIEVAEMMRQHNDPINAAERRMYADIEQTEPAHAIPEFLGPPTEVAHIFDLPPNHPPGEDE